MFRSPAYRIGLMLALSVLGSISQAATPKVKPQDPAVRLNQQIMTCLACHGTEGMKADPTFTVPKIGGQHTDYLVAALKAYKNGTRQSVFMQAQVAGLSDQDMQALAKYFSEAGEERVTPNPAAQPSNRLAGGQPGGQQQPAPESPPAKWMVACVACHGGQGLGNMPDYPNLASQHQDYLLHALTEYRSGKRNHPFMPIYAKTLSESEMQELTKYLSNQRVSLTIGLAPVDRAIQSIAMIDIPAGEFLMGTNATRDPNLGRPEHKVTVPAFRMGKYAVTFDQYDAFAIDTNRALPSDMGWGRGSRPVINVTLKDTEDFIAWLNKKTKKKYRLPSEAEREYAMRAGSTTDFWWGDTLDPEYVNGNGVKGRDQWQYTAPVGQFLPNKFGLYDMSGNVWERTADCWHPDYAGAPIDGSAWVEATCHDRVIRGSYWGVPRVGHFTRYRAIAADAYGGTGLGFRLAEDKE